MIRINLLGDNVSYDSNSLLWLIGYVASVLLTIGLGIGSWLYLSSLNEELREETVLLERQLNRLKDQTKEVKELDARKNELQAMTMTIAALKQIQEGPVKLMEDLNAAVPDRLWFQSIELKENQLRIEGIALIDAALIELIRGLEKSPYFERVDLADRTTVPLAQINAFSTFDSSQSRKVVRGERDKVTAALQDIRTEVERLGLVYVLGLPDALLPQLKPVVGQAGTQTAPPAEGLKRISGRPSVYVWESLEQVRGESFAIDAKVRLTPKVIPLDAIAAGINVPAAGTPSPNAPTNKKKAEEE